MLEYIALVSFVFCINPTAVAGQVLQQRFFSHCSIWGDPHLSYFNYERTPIKSKPSLWCNLQEKPTLLFRNRFVSINVVSNRTRDVIADFFIELYDQHGQRIYTVRPTDFLQSASVQQFGYSGIYMQRNRTTYNPRISIVHNNATLSIYVTKKLWSETTHYAIVLFATLAAANTSEGMCKNGCPPMTNTRSLLSTHSRSSNYVASLLAEEICDIYIKELENTQRETQSNLALFIEETRESCVNDITMTGNPQFGEDTVDNIIIQLVSSKIKELHQILPMLDDGAALAERVSNLAKPKALKLVADSTWPCSPDSYYCIAPDGMMIRKK